MSAAKYVCATILSLKRATPQGEPPLPALQAIMNHGREGKARPTEANKNAL